MPEWVRLTFTNLVYQINLLTQSASFVSGTVGVEVGDTPDVTGTMSVSEGSLSGTLAMDGQTVATIRVIGGFIVITPTAG